MPTLVIYTVSKADSLVASIRDVQPHKVIFVPSKETRDAVEKTEEQLAGTPSSITGKYTVYQVDDPSDLVRCIKQMSYITSDVDNWTQNGPNYEVLVDITGGTKPMSVALALIAHRWKCEFIYVGGDKRTQGGTGSVITGEERVIRKINPWDILGYQAIEDAVTLFNQGAYHSASSLLSSAVRSSNEPDVKRELGTLRSLIDGYAKWDLFQHKDAANNLSDAAKNLNDLRHIFGRSAEDLAGVLQTSIDFIECLLQADKPGPLFIKDLLANALRRGDEGRYDDAVARLYRIIEVVAQFRLRDEHDIDSSSVSLDEVPEPLREEWAYRTQDGALKLGLFDDYRLLEALRDDLAQRFHETGLDDPKQSPLISRNHSICAHGFQPVTEKTYVRMRDAALHIVTQEASELPVFPRLSVEGLHV